MSSLPERTNTDKLAPAVPERNVAHASGHEVEAVKLRSIMFYGRMPGAERAFREYWWRNSGREYQHTLTSPGLAVFFAQHSGAVVAAAALSLIPKTSPVASEALQNFILLGQGRPPVRVDVEFDTTPNRSIAHGFSTKGMLAPDFKGHSGVTTMHRNHTFESQRGSSTKLVAPIPIEAPGLHWNSRSSESTSTMIKSSVRCRVKVRCMDQDRLSKLRQLIKEDPLPFLCWCILVGPTLM